MIKVIDGDLLTSNADIIVQQCNNQGVMGSGIAKQIRNQHPVVYETYRKKYLSFNSLELGSIVYCEDGKQMFANLITQDGYGTDGKQYTDINELNKALLSLKNFVDVSYDKDVVIGFPYKMSCCRGGADWDLVYSFIEVIFFNNNVEIWRKDNG